MFQVKLVTSEGEKEFTAKNFFQVVVLGEGKIVYRWEKENGENEQVTYRRIHTITEKKVS